MLFSCEILSFPARSCQAFYWRKEDQSHLRSWTLVLLLLLVDSRSFFTTTLFPFIFFSSTWRFCVLVVFSHVFSFSLFLYLLFVVLLFFALLCFPPSLFFSPISFTFVCVFTSPFSYFAFFFSPKQFFYPIIIIIIPRSRRQQNTRNYTSKISSLLDGEKLLLSFREPSSNDGGVYECRGKFQVSVSLYAQIDVSFYRKLCDWKESFMTKKKGLSLFFILKNNVIDTWQSAQEQSISCSLSPSLAFFPCFPWPIRWFPSISPPTPVLSPCNPRSRHEEGKSKIAFPSFLCLTLILLFVVFKFSVLFFRGGLSGLLVFYFLLFCLLSFRFIFSWQRLLSGVLRPLILFRDT